MNKINGTREIEQHGAIDSRVEELKKQDKLTWEQSEVSFTDALRQTEIKHNNLYADFFAGLTPGELLEMVAYFEKQGYYEPESFEYVALAPDISPGAVLMYLGWVDPPGEEMPLKTASGARRLMRRHGPKWLVNGEPMIVHIPVTALRPVNYEINEDLTDILGIAPNPRTPGKRGKRTKGTKPGRGNKGKK